MISNELLVQASGAAQNDIDSSTAALRVQENVEKVSHRTLDARIRVYKLRWRSGVDKRIEPMLRMARVSTLLPGLGCLCLNGAQMCFHVSSHFRRTQRPQLSHALGSA